MTKSEQSSVDTKTCPVCGGNWPSDRRNCLACGANLGMVPARPPGEEQLRKPLNWAWLDAMADEEMPSETPEPEDDEQKPGCLSRFFPG
jgi:hypothetical protein